MPSKLLRSRTVTAKNELFSLKYINLYAGFVNAGEMPTRSVVQGKTSPTGLGELPLSEPLSRPGFYNVSEGACPPPGLPAPPLTSLVLKEKQRGRRAELSSPSSQQPRRKGTQGSVW